MSGPPLISLTLGIKVIALTPVLTALVHSLWLQSHVMSRQRLVFVVQLVQRGHVLPLRVQQLHRHLVSRVCQTQRETLTREAVGFVSTRSDLFSAEQNKDMKVIHSSFPAPVKL